MSDANEPNAQPTTPSPIPTPEEQSEIAARAWANATNDPDEVIEDEERLADDADAPPLDPNKVKAEGEGDPEPEVEDDDPPPEFWSKERKEEWKKITDPAIRAAIKDHYEEATRATSAKIEEAAKARKEAETKAAEFEREREQSVAWWQQAGPAIQQALQGKWAHFTPEYRQQLADENPAQSVKEEAAYRLDSERFQQLSQRQQQEAQAVAERAKEHHQRERAAEHAKLAAKYPTEFGGEKAQETYNTLSKFVLDHGVSADRLEGIYEAPVVEIIRKAYKYDQLQAKAKEVTTPKPNPQNAAKTPTRVAPGAPARSANPSGEAERQALQALRSGGKLTAEQMAAAFR